MSRVRVVLAGVSAVALLAVGAVVALAAPNALGRAASPGNGAARAVYCSDATVEQLKAIVKAYKARIPRDRARYFRSHRSKKARARFVKLQNGQLATLKKKLGRCT